MIFANITDIKIPEGNVVKIQESTSGRVLWEKKESIILNRKSYGVYSEYKSTYSVPDILDVPNEKDFEIGDTITSHFFDASSRQYIFPEDTEWSFTEVAPDITFFKDTADYTSTFINDQQYFDIAYSIIKLSSTIGNKVKFLGVDWDTLKVFANQWADYLNSRYGHSITKTKYPSALFRASLDLYTPSFDYKPYPCLMEFRLSLDW